MDKRMLIGDMFLPGTGEVEQIIDPRTGALLHEIPGASTDQVNLAVSAAVKAFDGWSRTAPGERARLLLKVADAIEADAAGFAALEAANTGKPYHMMLNDEMPSIVDCFRFFAGAVRAMTTPAAGDYVPGYTSMLRRDPVGVIASIAPWNYPLMMAAWKLAPAIAAGNTVVIKPSENTPLSLMKLGQIFSEILPPGVVNIVLGRGHIVGQHLIDHPWVDMVSLTGDVVTGRKVLSSAVKSIKRTHLELGGKAPVLVYGDADVEKLVSGIRAYGFYNAGQDCTAACRMYVDDSIYERVVADLTSAVATIRFGLADDTQNEMPPLISARQRSRVAAFVQRAAELSKLPPVAWSRAGRAFSIRRRSWPMRSNRMRLCRRKCSGRWFRSPA